MKASEKTKINLRLLTIRGGAKRGDYLRKKKIFKKFGKNVWWQPYKIPSNPELISIGDNVNIATEVLFLDHDIIHIMLNNMRTMLGGGYLNRMLVQLRSETMFLSAEEVQFYIM